MGALEKSINCGFVRNEKDGYEKDDVRKRGGERTEMMDFHGRPIFPRPSTFEVTIVISKSR